MEQIISIEPNGAMHTLRQKKGQGLDLREFGEVEMTRVSSVELDENTQQYFVKFLSGHLGNRVLTKGLYARANNEDLNIAELSDVLYFDYYEDGVQAEILVLNDVQKNESAYPVHLLNLVSPL